MADPPASTLAFQGLTLLECSIRESDLTDGAPVSQQECWLVIAFKSSCFHFFILELNFRDRGLERVMFSYIYVYIYIKYFYSSNQCRNFHHIKTLQFLVLTSSREMAAISAFCHEACKEWPGSALYCAFPLPIH